MDWIFLGQLINWDSEIRLEIQIKIKTSSFFDILFINEVSVLLTPYVAYSDCPLNIEEVSGLNSCLIERLILYTIHY